MRGSPHQIIPPDSTSRSSEPRTNEFSYLALYLGRPGSRRRILSLSRTKNHPKQDIPYLRRPPEPEKAEGAFPRPISLSYLLTYPIYPPIYLPTYTTKRPFLPIRHRQVEEDRHISLIQPTNSKPLSSLLLILLLPSHATNISRQKEEAQEEGRCPFHQYHLPIFLSLSSTAVPCEHCLSIASLVGLEAHFLCSPSLVYPCMHVPRCQRGERHSIRSLDHGGAKLTSTMAGRLASHTVRPHGADGEHEGGPDGMCAGPLSGVAARTFLSPGEG